jgi:hypothetical protein
MAMPEGGSLVTITGQTCLASFFPKQHGTPRLFWEMALEKRRCLSFYKTRL